MSEPWIRSRKIAFKGFNTLEVLDTAIGEREVLHRKPCVNVMLYDPIGRRVLLVRQARAAFADVKPPDGMVTESVAGILDTGETVMQTIVREVLEEVGVRLMEEDIVLLNHGVPMPTSSGFTDEVATLAYAELPSGSFDPEQNDFGLADEGEHTQRVWIPLDQLESHVFEDGRAFAMAQYVLRKHSG